MDPRELTAEDVRYELEIIIKENPDRYGTTDGTPRRSNGSFCVYFKDEEGEGVGLGYKKGDQTKTLTTPVCIVGQWIEQYHPEFKEHNEMSYGIYNNEGVSAWEGCFQDDVQELLERAQIQQDQNIPWGDIDLDWNWREKGEA